MARTYVEVRVIGGVSQFVAVAKKKGEAITRRRLDALGLDVAARTNAIVKNDYGYRYGGRRHLRGPHLRGSFYCVVQGDAFPFTLVLRSRASKDKVKYLNEGTLPHTISAKTGQFMYFPSHPTRGPRQSQFTKGPYANSYIVSNPRYRRATLVEHPGIAPGRFMERGMESGVRAAYKKSLKLRR